VSFDKIQDIAVTILMVCVVLMVPAVVILIWKMVYEVVLR